ncbi:hypothetical protein H5410_005449 [Solanum commersonii]|uniref:F-box protein n=1 Tax=Solanum commersonii TaxID=4109 RepID=A0A9J6A897_SOLCO|nr:hypothetical protein H5410_005449 [Solanum commersonii]
MLNLFNASRLCIYHDVKSSMTLISSSCKSTNPFNIGLINKSSMSVNSQVVSLQLPKFLMSEDISYPLVSYVTTCHCNPYVLKRVKCYKHTLYGFVYDFVSDDYKMITTFVINAMDSHDIVGIYYVKNESWKKIDSIPSSMMQSRPTKRNGSSEFNKFSITYLNVTGEKFVVIPVLSQYCESHMKMFNFANNLYLFVFFCDRFLGVFVQERWVMVDMD